MAGMSQHAFLACLDPDYLGFHDDGPAIAREATAGPSVFDTNP